MIMTPSASPKDIFKVAEAKLRIAWEDGHESEYSFALLRRRCPCAVCTDEWTGKTLLDPTKIPDDIKADKVELVGNYALAFQFADGHSTGIYTFERLRAWCPCPGCARG